MPPSDPTRATTARTRCRRCLEWNDGDPWYCPRCGKETTSTPHDGGELGDHGLHGFELPAVDRILWEHDRSSVDELVVYNATVHLEQMSDDCYWLGIERDGRMLMVNVYRTRKGGPLQCNVETDDGEDWPWDRDEEHPA